jgi:hypothetical protein
LGVSASAGTIFVLPQGAVPISLAVITPSSGATSTVDIGSAANSTAFGNEVVTGTAGVKVLSGAGCNRKLELQLTLLFTQTLVQQQVQEQLQLYLHML